MQLARGNGAASVQPGAAAAGQPGRARGQRACHPRRTCEQKLALVAAAASTLCGVCALVDRQEGFRLARHALADEEGAQGLMCGWLTAKRELPFRSKKLVAFPVLRRISSRSFVHLWIVGCSCSGCTRLIGTSNRLSTQTNSPQAKLPRQRDRRFHADDRADGSAA